MQYQYEVADQNYQDFSSGRVLYNQPGATAFPVRLAKEIFQRCLARLLARTEQTTFCLYDPCCGGGYLLTTIGLLHGENISQLIASDVDPEMVKLAERNLGLLTPDGIRRRIQQIKADIQRFNKDSHKQALASALRIGKLVATYPQTPLLRFFIRDGLQDTCQIQGPIDMVITDIPYGQAAHWSLECEDPVHLLLTNLYPSLAAQAIVAVVTGKQQKIRHSHYQRVAGFSVGKRQITLLETR